MVAVDETDDAEELLVDVEAEVEAVDAVVAAPAELPPEERLVDEEEPALELAPWASLVTASASASSELLSPSISLTVIEGVSPGPSAAPRAGPANSPGKPPLPISVPAEAMATG